MAAPVVVARGWGDWRRIEVPLDALSGWHVTSSAGGTKAPLPRPTLAGYMSCEEIPADADFGHSCVHGVGPHQIKVLVFKSHNPKAVYERLLAQAERRTA